MIWSNASSEKFTDIISQIGRMPTIEGDSLDADASLENEPGFLFDALVLPGGEAAVQALAADAHAIEGIANVYRHCKPMLVMPASVALLKAAGINPQTVDSGIVMVAADTGQAIAAFVKALGGPRAFERESDPPRV